MFERNSEELKAAAKEIFKEGWQNYLNLAKTRPDEFAELFNMEIIFDENVAAEYAFESGRQLGIIYESEYNYFVVDLVRSSDELTCYERVIPRNQGAVVIVPVYMGKFILLKQARHATRDLQYAFPRGYGEKDINPEENGKKELYEEIGYFFNKKEFIKRFKFIGEVAADSGLSSGKAAVYFAELKENTLINSLYADNYDKAEEDEFIKTSEIVHEGILGMTLVSPKEISNMITEGNIIDGFTLSALTLLRAGGLM